MKFNTKEERDKFILDNLELVDYVIENNLKYYNFYEYSKRDLKSMGTIGLIKAVDSFDKNREVKFSTYAIPKIYGEIINKARTTKDGIMYGLKIISNKQRIQDLKYKHNKTYKEIANKLNLTEKEVEDICRCSFKIESLDKKIGTRADTGAETDVTYLDVLEDKSSSNFENEVIVKDLLSNLKKREEYILTKYFFEGFRKKEIAEQLGISESWVFKTIKKSLNKLKKVC